MMPAIDQLTLLPNLDSHSCFGCSPRNTAGLRMQFSTDGESVFSSLIVPPHLCGWERLIHGGVISTILDEIMGRTVIYRLRKLGLTRSMTIDFLKPLRIGESILAQGRILEQIGDRKARVEGLIMSGDGRIGARSVGEFALFTPEAIARHGIIGPETMDQMARLLDNTPLPDRRAGN